MVATEPELTGALLEGRYQVSELLAVGGMSRVYRGTDLRLDRAVAIKVMDPKLAADPAFRNRFEREARAIARIDHPSVIGVYDQGEHGGPPDPVVYLVMELVAGGTLRDVLRERGALRVAEALAVLEPVLAALAAAHAQGLAHRDVKPENVLIGRSGVVKVADFGLVTAAAQARASTAGMIIGTVAYLSPEQVTGRGIDARSDVYAAGVLLYEMLTGAPPYEAESALSVAYRHVNEDVPAPSSVRPGLPPELDALVVNATRRDPAARPPDAATFLHEVLGVRAALGIERAPVPLPSAQQATVPAGPPAGGGPWGEPAPRPRATRALTNAGVSEWTAPAPGGALADASDHTRRRRRSRRVFAAWVLGVVLLAILVAALAWSAGSGRWAATPAVLGMDQATASRVVQEAGLVPVVRQQHHDTVPAGQVAVSTPAANTKVAKGSSVTLTVSLGRPKVPPITPGTSVTQAEQVIRDADLTVSPGPPAHDYDPSTPAGSVLATTPKPGTELKIGSPVALVVSDGPQPDRRSRHRDPGDSSPGDSLADEIQRRIGELLGG